MALGSLCVLMLGSVSRIREERARFESSTCTGTGSLQTVIWSLASNLSEHEVCMLHSGKYHLLIKKAAIVSTDSAHVDPYQFGTVNKYICRIFCKKLDPALVHKYLLVSKQNLSVGKRIV